MPFPPNFAWGAASSAYQIEGGWDADGKGPSNWDAYCHQHVPPGGTVQALGVTASPGNVFQNQTGDVACDHYHRFREDVAIMKDMGLKAYRFSISWPRVVPSGMIGGGGSVNAAGLRFYSDLVDALLGAGIEPWVTLFHWDLPLALWRRGAWHNREIVGHFADYAGAVVGALSDRVTKWMTLNEPQIFLGPGEHEGLQTSNARASHAQRLLAGHHALLAHGAAAQVIRASAKKPAQVGWAPVGRIKVPASSEAADVEAARSATLSVHTRDFWNNTWFADPVFLGRYPQDGLELYAEALEGAPEVGAALRNEADLAQIRQPIDFYGLNIYDAERVAAGLEGPRRIEFPAGHPRTAFHWFVEPEALYWGPRFIYERYRTPIVITENGMSSHDWVDLDGRVRDPQRIDYTRRYLLQLERAIADGVDVRGYFHWSILDNFEWQSGYRERFGLVHVDFERQTRTVKDSGRWYAEVIRSNGKALRSM